ncbi:MFS transporter [Solibacillus sp. FSL W7-1464]|uniref:MFS transporter n=1 Tax=Solibacillus sp. FSL W7-1464 TaxID=2921706 RepID=UPI0030FB4573
MAFTFRNQTTFLFVSFLFWVSQFIYVPVLAPYIESQGGKYTFIGLVLGSYGVFQLISRMPIGIFSDLLKIRKPFILFGLFISALSCLTFAITDQLGWILVARSLAGLAAATWVVFTVLYSSYFTDQQITKAMGSISLVVVLAQFTGMGLSGYAIAQWGWNGPFWLGAIIALIGMLLSVLVFESKEKVTSEPIRFKELTSIITYVPLIKVSVLSIVAHGILFTTMFGFTPAYALEIGFKATDISLVTIAFMIPHAIAAIVSGKYFVPMLGKWRTLQLAFCSVTVFTLLTPVIDGKLLFCILQIFNGFSLGLLFPVLLAMVVELVPYQKRATAMGVYQALYALGMFIGPFVGGILNSYLGIGGAFYLSGIAGSIATIFTFIWNFKEQNKLNVQPD